MVPSILLNHIHRYFKSIFIIAIKSYIFGRLLDNLKQKTDGGRKARASRWNFAAATAGIGGWNNKGDHLKKNEVVGSAGGSMAVMKSGGRERI